jgi:pyruvate formate lyase activating enzyme
MLNVGGLTAFTTIDFPGELAAVVFCRGCPWRCGYCHNRHLQDAAGDGAISWAGVLAFLRRRRGLLDAVVFSGGEPTLQPGLAAAVREVKSLGFKAGLHTAGPYPARLAGVLPFLDWVGMDVKAPFEEYERITAVPGSGEAARESADLLRRSGVRHQFRVTLDPFLAKRGRLERMKRIIEGWGSTLVLQPLTSRTDPAASNGKEPSQWPSAPPVSGIPASESTGG